MLWSNVIHEADDVFEFLTMGMMSSLYLSMISRSFNFSHYHLFQAQVIHALLETNDFTVCLCYHNFTKLYIIS